MPALSIYIVAALHLVFFLLESVLWTKPGVRRAFGNSAEAAEATKILALNQGFYNLGAAALLVVFQVDGNVGGATGVLVFLAAMGVVGAISASRVILVLQTVPALIALWLNS
jgi:putative membrane protein